MSCFSVSSVSVVDIVVELGEVVVAVNSTFKLSQLIKKLRNSSQDNKEISIKEKISVILKN